MNSFDRSSLRAFNEPWVVWTIVTWLDCC